MLAWMMMGLVGLICIGSVVYLAARVRRFGPIQRLSKKRRALSWLIGFALVLIPTAALCLLWTPLNMAVCLLHLTLFWLLSDLVFALIRRLRHAADAYLSRKGLRDAPCRFDILEFSRAGIFYMENAF